MYRIAKWSEVFEKSEARRIKSLAWVSMPIGFSSHGYQSMIEEFKDQAPAIYGAWCALVALASTLPTRGVLASSRGVPITLDAIARQTFFPVEVYRRLFVWAVKPEIGWILEDTVPAQNTPGESPENLQRMDGLQDKTEQNITQHNRTGPDKTGVVVGRSVVFLDSDWEPSLERARRVRKVLPFEVDERESIAICWTAISAGCGQMLLESAKTCNQTTVRNPKRYWAGAVKKAVEEAGYNYNQALDSCPMPEPVKPV